MTLLALFLFLGGARAQQALPYEYGFEDNDLSTDGWVLQGKTASNTGINSNAARTDSYGFCINYSEKNFYLLSPILTGGDAGVEVSFWYKEYSSQYGDEQFQVGYTTDENVTDASAFTYGDVVTASTSWQEYTNTFPAGTKRIAIKYIYSDTFYLFLDDFSFEEVSSCKKPKNLVASEITATSVKLTWEGTASDWVIGYVADDPYEEYDLVPGVTGNTYTITGLDPETLYYVAVRPSCDMTKWCDQVSFTTLTKYPAPSNVAVSNVTTTSATISWTGDAGKYNLRYRSATEGSVVFFDDFENGLDQWTIYTEGTAPQANGWYTIDPMSGLSFESHGGTYCASAWSWSNSAYDANNWLITPKVAFGGTLTFWVRTNSGYPDSYEVLLSTTGNAKADFTIELQAMAPAPNNGEWNQVVIDLRAYAQEEGYIAIHHVDNDMNYLLIDDVTITSPDTPTSDWTVVNDATSPYALTGLDENTYYQVEVQGVYTDGTSAWAGTGFTTLSSNPIPTGVAVTPSHTTATISWTANSDSYEVKYRTSVANGPAIIFEDFENGLGAWQAISSNTENDAIITTAAALNGSYSFAFESWNQANDYNQYLISPELTEIGILRFYYATYGQYGPESFEIGYSTSGNDVSDFNWDTTTATSYSGTTWKEFSYVIPTGTKYIAIHYTSNYRAYLYIDDIGIYGDNIPAGAWTTVSTNDTSVEITGLEMDTEYDYQIFGIKGGIPNEGTAIQTFKTYSADDKLFLADGDWDEDANWVPAGVPTETQKVHLFAAATIPSGVVATAKSIEMNTGAVITIKDGGELKTMSEVEVTMEKDITGYGNGDDKFYFISSPASGGSTSTNVEGLMEGDYDYFRFVRSMNLEWRSYALTSFDMSPGNGYLYANKEDKTLKFTGETWVSKGNALSMSATYDASYPMSMILAGNPYTCTGTIYFENNSGNLTGTIYKLNAAGNGFEAYEGYASVAPGEAVLVEYSESGTIYFESEDYGDGNSLGAADILLPKHGSTANVDAGPVIALDNDATDNGTMIQTYDGKSVAVRLTNRTLYKDGNWNTLCLPFNVTLEGSPLEGATAKTLTTATDAGETIVLNFGDAVTALQANTPYIIKWDSGDNIVDPLFTYVTLANADTDARTKSMTGVKFIGYYDAFDITPADQYIYYMTGNNTLKYTEVNRTLKSLRAYFDFSDVATAREFILDFGDGTTTGIDQMENGRKIEESVYDLQGRKVNNQNGPIRNGLYIVNGKKTVVNNTKK